MRKKWNFIFEWKFHINMTNRDINAVTSIVFSWSCIATDAFMWPFNGWIFSGFKFTWFAYLFQYNCSLLWYMSILIMFCFSVPVPWFTSWIQYLMVYNIKNTKLTGRLDKPSLLLHVSFERVIEKNVNPKSCYRAFVPTNFVKLNRYPVLPKKYYI